jgi:hypothetical protein
LRASAASSKAWGENPIDFCCHRWIVAWHQKNDPILNDGRQFSGSHETWIFEKRMGQLARKLFEKRFSCNKIYSSAGLATLIIWIEPAAKLQFDPLVLLSRPLRGFYRVLDTLISSGSPF